MDYHRHMQKLNFIVVLTTGFLAVTLSLRSEAKPAPLVWMIKPELIREAGLSWDQSAIYLLRGDTVEIRSTKTLELLKAMKVRPGANRLLSAPGDGFSYLVGGNSLVFMRTAEAGDEIKTFESQSGMEPPVFSLDGRRFALVHRLSLIGLDADIKPHHGDLLEIYEFPSMRLLHRSENRRI